MCTVKNVSQQIDPRYANNGTPDHNGYGEESAFTTDTTFVGPRDSRSPFLNQWTLCL